jgi:DNA-directed RNA polymerase subunit RPC12/RpoP
MRNSKKYAKNFHKRAKAAKIAAGWMCSECGVIHGSKRWSRWVGKEVDVWLQAHHLNGDPENPDAVLVIVCPRCHWHVYHKPRPGEPRPAWYIESLKHKKLIQIAYLS